MGRGFCRLYMKVARPPFEQLSYSYRSQSVETFGASLGKGGTYALLFAQRRFHAPIRALRIHVPLVGSHKYHLFPVSLTCNKL